MYSPQEGRRAVLLVPWHPLSCLHQSTRAPLRRLTVERQNPLGWELGSGPCTTTVG